MDISDEVMRRAKKRATDEGIPLRDLVERALRKYLDERPRRTGYKLRWRVESGRLLPGVDINDRNSLFDRMDGRD